MIKLIEEGHAPENIKDLYNSEYIHITNLDNSVLKSMKQEAFAFAKANTSIYFPKQREIYQYLHDVLYHHFNNPNYWRNYKS